MADQKVKVSSLTAASNITNSDLIYLVQGGQSKKLPFSVVRGLLTTGDFINGDFDNSDLVNGELPINHGKGTTDIMIFVGKPDGWWYMPEFKKTDSNNAKINFGGPGSSIDSGTWSYMMVYFNGASSSTAATTETILDIGPWNMDANDTYVIPHGLDVSKIINVSAMIRPDEAINPVNFEGYYGQGTNSSYASDYNKLSKIAISETNIVLIRTAGCSFDSVGYDSLAINRGKILIKHYI